MLPRLSKIFVDFIPILLKFGSFSFYSEKEKMKALISSVGKMSKLDTSVIKV